MDTAQMAQLRQIAAGAFTEHDRRHCYFIQQHIVEQTQVSWERAFNGLVKMIEAGIIEPVDEQNTIYKLNTINNDDVV